MNNESMGMPYTFWGFFSEFTYVEIPRIQRDYAQGRGGQESLRSDFLGVIERALFGNDMSKPKPLRLDFIYGSEVEIEGLRIFQPLDGQQRLTTLFLLHWYAAHQADQMDAFRSGFCCGKKSKLRYRVRPSSEDFLDALVSNPVPDEAGEMPFSQEITNASWFISSWERDPTVASVLRMLDSIHEHLREERHTQLWERLSVENKKMVEFHVLPLDELKQTDSLYIKMNARGVPLTPLEVFKGKFVKHLRDELADPDRAKVFEERVDGKWAVWLWGRTKDLFDGQVMNLIRGAARVSLDPARADFETVNKRLANSEEAWSFQKLYDLKCLTEKMAENLVNLLDRWSGKATEFPKVWFFDEEALVNDLLVGKLLPIPRLIEFRAFVAAVKGAPELSPDEEWMRIVGNLTENASFKDAGNLRDAFRTIDKLSEHIGEITGYLAGSCVDLKGFEGYLCVEERDKAILLNEEKCTLADLRDVETHAYFRGDVSFIFRASSSPNTSEDRLWSTEGFSLERFRRMSKVAKDLFSDGGLCSCGNRLFERALLCEGDYLGQVGVSHTFFGNTNDAACSWKRLLRGRDIGSEDPNALARLLAKLDPSRSMLEQLSSLVEDGVDAVNCEWRRAVVNYPEVLDHCQNLRVRWSESNQSLKLVNQTYISGGKGYAELFTYCLQFDESWKEAESFEMEYTFSETYATPPSLCLKVTGSLRLELREGSAEDVHPTLDIEIKNGGVSILKRIRFSDRAEILTLVERLASGSTEYSLLSELPVSESLSEVSG